MDVQIHASWKEVLAQEFQKPYFPAIKSFLMAERAAGHVIFPSGPNIFNAFNTTPFPKVKVVILGQDPYHGPGQAHGLSFSVLDDVKQPPSLKNIFKEVHADLGHSIPNHGNLTPWAEEGVLLLNAILTVRAHSPASHRNCGWETFTDAVIHTISLQSTGVVFLLWGKFAQEKVGLIDQSKHAVLTAPHPSPFSAHKGFFGCKHFSKTNTLLQQMGKAPINWAL
ncbi:MAG: uracil-DNA glycosylase [Saprospiraceae bacterium]|nr:uracil-DNA glycosylase [Saprospiraceae bacterium]